MDEVEFSKFLDRLAKAGIKPAIVPIRPGTKIPAVRWRDMGPGEQILGPPGTTARAILTGSRSGGIVVIDVDTATGGFDSLAELEAKIGVLPATLQVRSPTGGLHLYLSTTSALRSTAGVLAAGLDIRAEGGIVLTPGSAHPRGGIYRIEEI